MSPRPPAFLGVVFDLDGTIIDSVEDVTQALNHVLAGRGRPALPAAAVRGLIGQGARVLIERALAATGAPAAAAELDALVERFVAFYREHPADHTTVYPGAIEVLDRLSGAGIGLGICTNKPLATTEPVLELLGLAPLFRHVACGDRVPFRKPDGRHVLHLLDRMGVARGRAAMVGDSENDAGAAHDAGVPFVAVSWGYRQVAVEELKADVVIDRFEDLPRALADLSRARLPA